MFLYSLLLYTNQICKKESHIVTTYQVTATQPLISKNQRSGRSACLRQFDQFSGASALSELRQGTGQNFDDKFRSFKYSDDDSKSYKTVSESSHHTLLKNMM